MALLTMAILTMAILTMAGRQGLPAIRRDARGVAHVDERAADLQRHGGLRLQRLKGPGHAARGGGYIW